jgi:hypothetical protein
LSTIRWRIGDRRYLLSCGRSCGLEGFPQSREDMADSNPSAKTSGSIRCLVRHRNGGDRTKNASGYANLNDAPISYTVKSPEKLRVPRRNKQFFKISPSWTGCVLLQQMDKTPPRREGFASGRGLPLCQGTPSLVSTGCGHRIAACPWPIVMRPKVARDRRVAHKSHR